MTGSTIFRSSNANLELYVLESGVPSAEHVLNMLARLKQEAMPAQVETSLTLTEEPLADTARYDSLNVGEASHA